MHKGVKIKIIDATGEYAKGHLWVEVHGMYVQRYLGEFKMSNGIMAFYNYSTGSRELLYSNIDISGSVAGMRRNFGWKADTVVRAHGLWVNLDRSGLTTPIDALLFLLEKRLNRNIDKIINRELFIDYNMTEANLVREKHLENVST